MRSDYSDYFRRLSDRANAAVKVPFREVRLDGEQPKLNDCHGNVDRWVKKHPETEAVRGWLFWGANEAGQYLFMAHSILDENGQLVDITPLDRNTPREGLIFLEHLGTEEDFLEMKSSCAQVLYPPLSVASWQESQVAEFGGGMIQSGEDTGLEWN